MGESNVSRLRALVRRARYRSLRGDRAGSVHILETMVVGLMVVGAVVAVSTFNAPVSQTESFKSSQEQLVQDSLDALAGRPSQDMEAVVFDSLLEEYVMKAVAGKPGPLMGYLNRTLPAGSQYDVFMDTGFGRPLSVVDGGTPSGESLTGARSFVPKMSYVFMVPEFEKYQHDFHMNVLAIPMHNSILQKDEGVPVEVAVTFTTDKGETVTQRAYGETALRYNDPDARSWPSTSIYIKDDVSDADEVPRHYLDASHMQPYGQASVDTVLGGEKLGDVYNITIPLVVEESAGHPIPRGAQISVEFPRGWEFQDNKQAWMESELEHWTDFEWEGSDGEGWTIRARLKDPLKEGVVPFPITGDFVMLLDSAYPHFQPITTWMGGGAQGKSTILLKTPQEFDVGGLRREALLSLSKPMISGEESTWGVSFGNLGAKAEGTITIEKIELSQPGGVPLFDGINLNKSTGWTPGTWSWDTADPSRVTWTPKAGSALGESEAAWLSMRVIGGPTRDNHYRNHDYQDVLFRFDPNNTTGAGGGNWTHTQRAHQMGQEYVYRQMVPPLEDDGWPGWPDEEASYWFGAQSRQQSRYAVGNSSYQVDATAATAQVFGDYQGDHVLSKIDLSDPYGVDTRTFSVEDRVHIKNDFTALFTKLSTLDDKEVDLTVENIRMDTAVYTPEKAWTGVPTKNYSEDASFQHFKGTFSFTLPVDLTENGILDLIAVDSSGRIYGLDGRDGSKLYQLDHVDGIIQATLADVTADGRSDLVVADTDDVLTAYRLGIDLSETEREIWSVDLDPNVLDAFNKLDLDSDPARVTAIEDVSGAGAELGDPVVAVAYSSTTAGGSVFLVSTDKNKTGGYKGVVEAEHVSDTSLDDYTWIPDMLRIERDLGGGDKEHYLAVASMNQTVTVFSLSDFDVHWITSLPQRPHDLSAADLTGDGWDDLVVNTAQVKHADTADDDQTGDSVYVLPGRSGNFGPGVRGLASDVPEEFRPTDAEFTSKGWGAAVGGTSEFVQGHDGFYVAKLGLPNVGDCDAGSLTGKVNTGVMNKTVDDLDTWLNGEKWSGAHHDSADDGLYVVSKVGTVLQAVESCPDGGLRWTALHEGSGSAGPFNAIHSSSADGTMHRMNESGQIEAHDGESGWDLVADVCTMPELDPCENVTVNRWSVEEDEQGRPVRFWATLDWTDPSDDKTVVSHLASVPVGGFADPGITVADAKWSHESSSPDRRYHALETGSGGEVWFGGSTKEGGVFLMHRASQKVAFEEERLFYSVASQEHGGLLLDIQKASDGQEWAVSADGQVWKRTASGTWVPYPTWAGATDSAAFAEDPSGSVWLFLDEGDHLPLRTHHGSSELVFEVPVDDTDSSSQVEVEAEEAHVLAGGKQVTRVKWYARPTGSIPGTDQPHLWSPLGPYGMVNPYGSGWSTKDYIGSVDGWGASYSSIQVKAVLETLTLTGSDGKVLQDAGASPALGHTTITVKQDDQIVGSADLMSQEGVAQDDRSTLDPALEAMVLGVEPDRWMYRGGLNKEWAEDLAADQDNRRVGVGATLPTTSGRPGVAIADQSVGFEWWVLDGLTGAPGLPGSGPKGSSQSSDYVDVMLVGDVTGDQVDDVVIIGDLEDNRTAMIWDTQKDEWSYVAGFGDHIIPAAALMGRQDGRDTFIIAFPERSATLLLETQGLQADEAPALVSFYSPDYDKELTEYDDPEIRWSSAPHIMQGFTTFTYEIPKNSLYGTSLVVSELKFDLTIAGQTVTQTARLLDWFDILPPGRSKSVPPVYTVEVVAWFDEGYGKVERRALGDGDNPSSGGGDLNIIPDPKDQDGPSNVS